MRVRRKSSRSPVVPPSGAAVVACVIAACLLTSSPSPAQGAESDKDLVGRFVGETTVAVLKVQPNRLELPSADMLTAQVPRSLQSQVGPMLRQAAGLRQQIRAAFGESPFYVVVRIPASQDEAPAFLIAPLPEGRPVAPAKQLLQALSGREPVVQGRLLVAAPATVEDTKEQLAKIEPKDRPELWQALGAASRYPIQFAIAPPGYVRRTIDELLPRLPAEVGGGASSVWTKGFRSLTCGVDPAQFEVDVTVRAESAEAAKAFREELPRALAAALRSTGRFEWGVPQAVIAPLIAGDRFHAVGDRVHWRISDRKNAREAGAALGAVLGRIQSETERAKQRSRYKRVLAAFLEYDIRYRSLPPAEPHRPKDGKPGLSWRVHLLPFLGQKALYEQFHLDEPWDSPHNIKLLAKMPDVYSIRRSNRAEHVESKPGYTTCVAPVGKNTVMGQARPVTIGHIIDGTAYTIVLVEVQSRHAVPWTAPFDDEFDAKDPLARIARYDGRQWLAGMCDGSVHMLKADIPADVVLALFGINDGKSVRSVLFR